MGAAIDLSSSYLELAGLAMTRSDQGEVGRFAAVAAAEAALTDDLVVDGNASFATATKAVAARDTATVGASYRVALALEVIEHRKGRYDQARHMAMRASSDIRTSRAAPSSCSVAEHRWASVGLAIVRPAEPSGVLARRYGVSAETIREWRKRSLRQVRWGRTRDRRSRSVHPAVKDDETGANTIATMPLDAAIAYVASEPQFWTTPDRKGPKSNQQRPRTTGQSRATRESSTTPRRVQQKGRVPPLGRQKCVFRLKADGRSEARWTAVPTEAGQ